MKTIEQSNHKVLSDRTGTSGIKTRSDEVLSLPKLSSPSKRSFFIAFILLFLLIYFPRLARLQSYLLVAYKQNIALDSFFNASFSRLTEEFLADSVESPLKDFSKQLVSSSDALTLRVNRFLEKRNCPPNIVSTYAKARLLSTQEQNRRFERLCFYPLRAEYPVQRKLIRQEELSLLGFSSDGRIQIRPGDRVYLAGDSLMQGPAPMIRQRLIEEGADAINASQISTGLAYPQFFNWPQKIKDAIDQSSVSAVVVFLGANDTFDMYQGSQVLPVGSPEWLALYAKRVKSVAKYARENNVALIWIGMPAMNRSDIQPYVPMMNKIYKSIVLKYDGLYLSSAEVLGIDQDNYASTKQINGQTVVTRISDGVHFTPAGWGLIADQVLGKFSFQ